MNEIGLGLICLWLAKWPKKGPHIFLIPSIISSFIYFELRIECILNTENSSPKSPLIMPLEERPEFYSTSLRQFYESLPLGTFVRYDAERFFIKAMHLILPDFKRGLGNEMASLQALEDSLAQPSLIAVKKHLLRLQRQGSKVEAAFVASKSKQYFLSVQSCLSGVFKHLTEKLNTELDLHQIETNTDIIRRLVEFEPDIELFCNNSFYLEEVEIRICANYLMEVEIGNYQSEQWLSATDCMQSFFHIAFTNEPCSDREEKAITYKSTILRALGDDIRSYDAMSQSTMLEVMQCVENVLCKSNYNVVKRCLAHLSFHSTKSTDTSTISVPAAISIALSEACSELLPLDNDDHLVWTTTYLNDFGALDLGDKVARCFKPEELFLTNSRRIRTLLHELGRLNINEYDENGCRILAFTAAPFYEPNNDIYKYFGAIALRGADDVAHVGPYFSPEGFAKMSTIQVSWSDNLVSVEEISPNINPVGQVDSIRDIESKLADIWQSILTLLESGRRGDASLREKVHDSLFEVLGEEKPFTEEVEIMVKHYNNPLMFRPLRRSINVAGFTAKEPLGGTLTDVKDGENYVVSKTGRKIYVMREGNELKLLRKGVPKILYYVSKLEGGLGRLILKTDIREIIVNPHIGTATILEMLLSQTGRPDAVKYALRFIEDTGLSCSPESGCFLRRAEGGINVSGVLTAKTLSSADCYVNIAKNEIYIMIGTRMMRLVKVRRHVFHAVACRADYSLRRAHIEFGKIIVGVAG